MSTIEGETIVLVCKRNGGVWSVLNEVHADGIVNVSRIPRIHHDDIMIGKSISSLSQWFKLHERVHSLMCVYAYTNRAPGFMCQVIWKFNNEDGYRRFTANTFMGRQLVERKTNGRDDSGVYFGIYETLNDITPSQYKEIRIEHLDMMSEKERDEYITSQFNKIREVLNRTCGATLV